LDGDFSDGLSSGTGCAFSFGSFLLARQKKGTHRKVNSLLSGLAAKEKTIKTTEAARRAKKSNRLLLQARLASGPRLPHYPSKM
ncbi:hypothetical protein, partial [Rheinheimera texasensis]|uniref:hypothetical protein n=1 Tax=Rheinheimera texasensis TaxID=306205 RepID=UPI0032B2C6C4